MQQCRWVTLDVFSSQELNLTSVGLKKILVIFSLGLKPRLHQTLSVQSLWNQQ